MQITYEATAYPKKFDFANIADAKRFVESEGEGRVVTFVKGFDGRERSAAMIVFRNGAWDGVNIHE